MRNTPKIVIVSRRGFEYTSIITRSRIIPVPIRGSQAENAHFQYDQVGPFIQTPFRLERKSTKAAAREYNTRKPGTNQMSRLGLLIGQKSQPQDRRSWGK